jgi:thiamine monophosphate synthase
VPAQPELWLATDERYPALEVHAAVQAFVAAAGANAVVLVRTPLAADVLASLIDVAYVAGARVYLKRGVGAHFAWAHFAGAHFAGVGEHLGSAALAAAAPTGGQLPPRSSACHSDAELHLALELGVGTVLVSPIFPVPGKGDPRGPECLQRARKLIECAAQLSRPRIIALGGINVSNAGACMLAGADGVCVSRALLDQPSAQVGGATLRLLDAMHARWPSVAE